MARLQQSDGPASWLLPMRCLLGRSRVCTIRLDSPHVSGEHALLRWTGRVWELQDLQSRNGTFVDGRRVDAGRVLLAPGDVIGFGRPDGYVLTEADEPTPYAQQLGEQRGVLTAEDGLLALPDPMDPECTVYRHGRGWLLEAEGDVRPVEDGEQVQTRTGPWRLHLPERLPTTYDHQAEVTVTALALRFSVYRNEEYVELIARLGDHVIDLKARAHHYTLLQLARIRFADLHLAPEQQGWIHQEELITQLGSDAGRLHLDIHRIRRQFAGAGVVDAAHIIERRAGTRQLRIGASNLEIVPIDRRSREGASPRTK